MKITALGASLHARSGVVAHRVQGQAIRYACGAAAVPRAASGAFLHCAAAARREARKKIPTFVPLFTTPV